MSRKCDECLRVKRCEMYVDNGGGIVYLCALCRRALDYPRKPPLVVPPVGAFR